VIISEINQQRSHTVISSVLIRLNFRRSRRDLFMKCERITYVIISEINQQRRYTEI